MAPNLNVRISRITRSAQNAIKMPEPKVKHTWRWLKVMVSKTATEFAVYPSWASVGITRDGGRTVLVVSVRCPQIELEGTAQPLAFIDRLADVLNCPDLGRKEGSLENLTTIGDVRILHRAASWYQSNERFKNTRPPTPELIWAMRLRLPAMLLAAEKKRS